MEIIRPKNNGTGSFFSAIYRGKMFTERKSSASIPARCLFDDGEREGWWCGRGWKPFRVEIFNELL